VSDSWDIRERKPFVTFVGIVCNPGIIETRHEQKSSKNRESNSCHKTKHVGNMRFIFSRAILLHLASACNYIAKEPIRFFSKP
jgi:hypothetical protein